MGTNVTLAEVSRVWVSGEISNYSRPQSGHSYFTLKDDQAQIRAVMWRGTTEDTAQAIVDRINSYGSQPEYVASRFNDIINLMAADSGTDAGQDAPARAHELDGARLPDSGRRTRDQRRSGQFSSQAAILARCTRG